VQAFLWAQAKKARKPESAGLYSMATMKPWTARF
jgi:hypothetical protein